MTDTTKLRVGALEFDCRVSGNPENELVVFLHGFPETSFMWKKVMEKISSIGFYCIAPNLRGYSQNACPKGAKNYKVMQLREDILGIASALNKDKFHLVGHDWGAAIGWGITFYHPDKILSWSALSVPHTRAFSKAFKIDKDQRKRSGYIKWFLLPFVPELMIRRNDFKVFRNLWKHSSEEERADYLSVFRRREALTAALNYYRANIGRGKAERVGDINAPTLFIWGRKDKAIGLFAAENNQRYMKGPYTFLDLDGGHWLIQTNYNEVEAALIDHLTKYSIGN